MSEDDVHLVSRLLPDRQVIDVKEWIADDDYWADVGAHIDPDAPVRFVTADGGAIGGMAGPFYGSEGFRAGWREWLAAWHTFRAERGQITDAGGGTVVFAATNHGRLGPDAPEVSQEGAVVVRVEAGKIVGMDLYLDLDQARRAAGLD